MQGNRRVRAQGGPRRVCGRRAGFTLLEILIAASAMLIAMLGFSQALIGASKTQTLTRQQTLALEACRAQLELIKTETLRDRFREYNDAANDDVGGAGLAPGADFAVPGLQAVDGDADGLPGEIEYPVAPGTPNRLREDLDLPALGTPLDLDADGVIDALDHSGDYVILPVIVRVRWRSPCGPAVVQLQTILGEQM